jgi:polyphosphate:AMP phosphotransferase
MLGNLDMRGRVNKDEYRGRARDLGRELGELQRRAREAGVPVIVVFEGWDAAGKGTLINHLMLALDARGYTVYPIGPPTQEEEHRPFLWRFWLRTPPKGRIAIFDRSWYGRVLVERVERITPKMTWRRAYDEIVSFERQLTQAGVCIVKLFLHIGRGEQKKRFQKLEADPVTAWKVGRAEWKQHRRYNEYREAVEDMLTRTSTPWAPWTVVAAHQERWAALQMLQTVVAAVGRATGGTVAAGAGGPAAPAAGAASPPVRHAGLLATVDLQVRVDRGDYERKLPRLQRRLRELEHRIYLRRIGVAMVFEGWDAAGKGGNIRRMVQGLDPRGFQVIPVGAPNDTEKRQQYLWRFWRDVPKAGHIAIFDRSWYGRVLVERVEGLCSPEEWSRAYGEINEMEKQWTDSGMVLIKFWLHISREAQLARFEERRDTPHKHWKITDEDWRNREKWDRYLPAVEDMLAATSPPNAPWTMVASDCKFHGRIEVLSTAIDRIEARLDGV